MTNALKAGVRGAVAFGGGYVIALVAASALMHRSPPDIPFLEVVMAIAGGAGVATLLAGELRPARRLLATAGFAGGFFAAIAVTYFLLRNPVNIPVFSRTLVTEWVYITCALGGGLMLGGAMGGLSIRPALTWDGARAFAMGGLMFGLTGWPVMSKKVQDTNTLFFVVVFVALFAAVCTGGGFFGYWYQKRKDRGAANAVSAAEEGESEEHA